MPLWIHLVLLSSTVAAAGGQILLKMGAVGRNSPVEFANPWIACGLFCYGISAALWILALSKAPLSLVYPYTAVTFVLVYLCGPLLFRETVAVQSMAGVGLVLLGLLLINLGRTS